MNSATSNWTAAARRCSSRFWLSGGRRTASRSLPTRRSPIGPAPSATPRSPQRCSTGSCTGPRSWHRRPLLPAPRPPEQGRGHPSRGERLCLLITPPTPPRSRPRWPVAARSARPSSPSPPPPAARSSAHPPARKPTARTNPSSRPARPATPLSPPRSANAGSTARTSAGPPPAPARTPGRNEPAPCARALSMPSGQSARSTVHRPAARRRTQTRPSPGRRPGRPPRRETDTVATAGVATTAQTGQPSVITPTNPGTRPVGADRDPELSALPAADHHRRAACDPGRRPPLCPHDHPRHRSAAKDSMTIH